MKNKSLHIIIPVCIVLIAVLLLNPFHFWMPDLMVMSMLACIFVLFAIFASFILNEQAGDERESAHRTLAGRNAFLIGSAILMLGIIIQGYSHTLDFWLVASLSAMILTKVITRLWSDRNL